MKKLILGLLASACLCACQKPYEQTIKDSTKQSNPTLEYRCINISEPIEDEIDSTGWMPKTKVAFGGTKYIGKVNVVTHKYFLGENKDTITERWIFDGELNRVVTIMQ